MRTSLLASIALAAIGLLIAGGYALQTMKAGGGGDAAAIAGSGGLVTRQGPALSFRMKDGPLLTVTDRVRCGDLACPGPVAISYFYRGWDTNAGGYMIELHRADAATDMLLPFGTEPILDEAAHALPNPGGPMAMPAAPAPVAMDAAVTEWLAQTESARDQDEAPRLAESKGRAARAGGELSLALADGRRLALADDLACGQLACPAQLFRAFAYLGASPDGRFHAVGEQGDEAGGAMLIDSRDGSATGVIGPPLFSPDGSRAAASLTDLETPAPRRLEVWSLAGSAPALDFALTLDAGDDTLYDLVGWDDADHLRLRRGPWQGPRPARAMLAHDAAGWHLEEGN